jgi:hypothetical protein
MSGPRLYLGRLASVVCVPFLLMWSLSSCTVRTPGYCGSEADCTGGQRCGSNHACGTPDAGSDASQNDDVSHGAGGGGDGASRDAPADSPADATRPGDAGSDSRDGSDASDASDLSDASDILPGCGGIGDCTADPAKPVCQISTRTCVGCLVNQDCRDPHLPVCDATKVCRGCRVDVECLGAGAEVCMLLDGHCATDDETVYVRNNRTSGGCSNVDLAVPAGSSALPFCEAQLAIDATQIRAPRADAGADAGTPVAKDLVVMRGPEGLGFWSFARSDTLTVVGKANATISGATHDGITLSSGILYLRDLRISNGTNPGNGVAIRASGGELVADRLTVDTNLGGIFLSGASFAITNSVIANNQPATLGASVWSGIIVDQVPANGPAVLRNNTIVGNTVAALVCTATSRTQMAGLLFWNNNGSDVVGSCGNTPCCVDSSGVALNPMLTSDWHLISTSPCRDKLVSALSTGYDIDQQPRPYGTMSDCGADEYLPP